MSVPLNQWKEIWDREYLADYVASGGSTVKILVADSQHVSHVADSVAETAKNRNFITIFVDSATVKCHLIQEIYFDVARKFDWQTPTDLWLRSQLAEAGFGVPDGITLSDIENISAANGVDAKTIRNAANRIIYQKIMCDESLWYQFRVALAAYCTSRLGRVRLNDQDSELTLGWLRGENVSLSSLRRIRIAERIGRHNARPILISLARWCSMLDIPGICVVMNLGAVFSPTETSLRYARPALLDLYELLRQFIDETEEMSYLSIVAIADRGITDDPKVSYDNYDAFKMRVVNDVRDRVKENPLNTLVTVELDGTEVLAQ